MSKIMDLTGKKFGRLTAETRSSKNGRTYWRCVCSCGSQTEVERYSLTSGATRSCGCLRAEVSAKRQLSHGCSGGRKQEATAEYVAWRAMLDRCYNENYISYQNYGGRNVRVCARWRKTFSAFLLDVGPRPTSKHSLGRIDNSRGYTKANCRWETRNEQSRNRRDNVWLVVNGARKTMTDWAQERNLPVTTLHFRLRRGWTDEDAVLTPSQHTGYKQKRFDKKLDKITTVPREENA